MPSSVEVDTTDLERGMRKLAAGLDRAGSRVGMSEASDTARDIRAQVPVLSGRLAATVTAVPVRDGAAVTYGGGLPYAGYIEGRAHAVEDGLDGAERSFHGAMSDAAEREVRTL
jgi:hypothetical protein